MGKGWVGKSPGGDDSFRNAAIMAVQTPGDAGAKAVKGDSVHTL